MGSAISTTRSNTVAQKANESFDECQLFRGRLQLRTETGQWRKYEIIFDGSQISCPLWTIPIGDILVISTLKCKNQIASQCLCLRTIHDDTILLRGKNPEDIERWAFVLQKICSLAKTVKEYKMMLARKQRVNKENNVSAAKQHANHVSGTSSTRQRSRSTKARTRAERRAEHEQSAGTILLTEEKSEWINTWRQSLTDVEMEMMVPDLTSLPDDDERLSTASGMTSVSMRGRNHALRLAQATAAADMTNEKAAAAATLKGFKSLPNLLPKSSSRALVSERRRGNTDFPNDRTAVDNLPYEKCHSSASQPANLNILSEPPTERRRGNSEIPNDRIPIDPPYKKCYPSASQPANVNAYTETSDTHVATKPSMNDANDDTSTIESTHPRTPSRHLSSSLNKQGSESMPTIPYASHALCDSPSYQYINRPYAKQRPCYAKSDM
ncbi:hypothetical protein BGW37DRAFT_507386, partial [Umbelopsis sp. PMI_123]